MEAHQRQAILQQRILEAKESAKQAKLEARGTVNFAGRQPTVSFDTNCVTSSVEVGEGVLSSLSKSEFRSPSMLQLVDPPTEAGRHGDANPPPTQRSRANGVRKGGRTGRSKLAEGTVNHRDQRGNGSERTRRNSRIPVMRQSMGAASKSKTVINSRHQASKPGTENPNTQNNKLSKRRFREDDDRSVNVTTVRRRPVVERSVSPPVPVVAKRLKQQDFAKKDGFVSSHRTPLPESLNSTFTRSQSPPVPAVAKRLRNEEHGQRHVTETVYPSYERGPSPPVPAVARRLRNEEASQDHITTETVHPSYEREPSPPVPAVARRLRNEVSQGHETRHQSHERGASPPVPSVVKRLQQNKSEYDSELTAVPNKSRTTPVPVSTTKMKGPIQSLVAGDSDEVEMSINRPPSCKPNSSPLSSPVAMTTSTNLPAILTATSNYHHDKPQTILHSQSSNRQRLILQQLTMLKEGILTQQNTIDHRVQTILTQNKQCNF